MDDYWYVAARQHAQRLRHHTAHMRGNPIVATPSIFSGQHNLFQRLALWIKGKQHVSTKHTLLAVDTQPVQSTCSASAPPSSP